MSSESDEYSEECTGIVIDHGNETIKAGFAGDDIPRSVFPSIVGRPKVRQLMSNKVLYVGEEAQAKRGILDMTHPFENGVVTNWDDMEKVWEHTFYNELRVAPEEFRTLLTDTSFNPNTQKMGEIMFEKFSIPELCVVDGALTSIWAYGRTTGVVVKSGYNMTYVVPVRTIFIFLELTLPKCNTVIIVCF